MWTSIINGLKVLWTSGQAIPLLAKAGFIFLDWFVKEQSDKSKARQEFLKFLEDISDDAKESASLRKSYYRILEEERNKHEALEREEDKT